MVTRPRGHLEASDPRRFTIPPADEQRLLVLARRALEARVRRAGLPFVERGGVLDAAHGAFVTIHLLAELRGCLGRVEPDAPLADTVADLAAAVADSDPRFPPVAVHELARLVIEISVLTPASEVAGVAEIEVGRHGLTVEQGRRRGLLLPQVASERGWDAETFLEQTCRKAGLAPDAWRRGARIFRFEAHVFSETAG